MNIRNINSYSFYSKWSVIGQQSANDTDWQSVAIDIVEPFNYDIIIQGVRGDNFHSDIAIDDIVVTSLPCRKYEICSISLK